jgi:DNA-binding MarR family transcriptional regulator
VTGKAVRLTGNLVQDCAVTVDEYIAAADPDRREALRALREVIRDGPAAADHLHELGELNCGKGCIRFKQPELPLDVLRELDLDSAYLGRLLRMLEAEGLVVVEPGHDDRRVRIARLSKAGRTERNLLDRSSDELAWSLVEPLDEEQRARLLEAMGTVELLLTAGLVSIGIDEATSAAVRYCFESYFAELDARFEAGFDSGPSAL